MPSYRRAAYIAPGDVRRIRVAANLTQKEFAALLELASVRSVERYELDGATLEHASSLSMLYNRTRYAKLERVANQAGLALELVRVDVPGSVKYVARVKKPRPRLFTSGRR